LSKPEIDMNGVAMTELVSLLPPAQLYIASVVALTLVSILRSKHPKIRRIFWGREINFERFWTYLVLLLSWLHVVSLVGFGIFVAEERFNSISLYMHLIVLSLLAFAAVLVLRGREEQKTASTAAEEEDTLKIK